MKKKYHITELDCIVCANALEKKLNTIPGVQRAVVNYIMQQVSLDIDDTGFEAILERVKQAVDRSVPGAKLF